MKIITLFFLTALVISCSQDKNNKLLTEHAWISDKSDFVAVRFTEDGYGYDIINNRDTLSYSIDGNLFTLIDKKDNQERKIEFNIKKLDLDSFIIEINKEEGLRLKFRAAKINELVYGSWKNKDNEIETYKFLTPLDSGSGYRTNNANQDIKEFFTYKVNNNKLEIKSENISEQYEIEFDKTFNKLFLKGKNNIELIRTKFHSQLN